MATLSRTDISPPSSPLLTLQSFLSKYPKTKYVRLHILTYGNTPRGQVVTVARALEDARNPDAAAISTPSPTMYLALNFGGFTGDVNPKGDDWVADWSTIHPVALEPAYATVMCSVRQTKAGFAHDPRTILRRVEQAAREEGVEFLVGYEIEFHLLSSPDADSTIISPKGNSGAASYRHPSFAVLEQSVGALEEAGIPVWKFHKEGSTPGLFEIALCPQKPLVAVDNIAFAHEAIKTAAAKNGFHATMHPCAFPCGPTVGQHIHISYKKKGDLDAHSFLSGLLVHFRALTAWVNGGYDSYKGRRGKNGCGDVTWGQTKFVPIREVETGRFEVRTPDCLSNPYLQLAAVIAAGMEGLRRRTKLEIKPNPSTSGGALGDEERVQLGVKDTLPVNLKEALEALKGDREVFEAMMGEDCVEAYIRYKFGEVEEAEKMTDTDRRKAIVTAI